MKYLLVALVRAYRLLLSPWLGASCRFEPSCSRYAIEALERHGALGGSALAGWRLLRCHPWCDGGLDPVPDNPPWWRRRDDPSADPGGPADGPGRASPSAPGAGRGLLTRLVDADAPPPAGPRG